MNSWQPGYLQRPKNLGIRIADPDLRQRVALQRALDVVGLRRETDREDDVARREIRRQVHPCAIELFDDARRGLWELKDSHVRYTLAAKAGGNQSAYLSYTKRHPHQTSRATRTELPSRSRRTSQHVEVTRQWVSGKCDKTIAPR